MKLFNYFSTRIESDTCNICYNIDQVIFLLEGIIFITDMKIWRQCWMVTEILINWMQWKGLLG